MSDRSDVIARAQVLIMTLSDLFPDSGWKDDPFVAAYLNDRYCLSVRQMHYLTGMLEDHLKQCAARSGYVQPSLFDVWGDG